MTEPGGNPSPSRPGSSSAAPPPGPILVCFAVGDEQRFFKAAARRSREVRTLVTGVGRRCAESAITKALEAGRPGAVITAGFAGGLDPALPSGAVLFQAEPGSSWAARLLGAGAIPGRLLSSDRVATTAEDKRRLRVSTGADAVEMESQFIREVCRQRGVECAIVRVILDTAAEDLPLDFNLLTGANGKISPLRLAWALVKFPHKIPALIALGKRSRAAARRLSDVLERVV